MANSNHYIKRPCGICSKLITANGLAMTAHLRKHVREGKLIERCMDGRPAFASPDDVGTLTAMKDQSRVGHYF